MWRQMIVLFQFLVFHSCLEKPTCYKNSNEPSCIDLILTNKPESFQHYCVIEAGLPDFHTVRKTFFEKLQPRVVHYRKYKHFENNRFRSDLLSELGKASIEEKAD